MLWWRGIFTFLQVIATIYPKNKYLGRKQSDERKKNSLIEYLLCSRWLCYHRLRCPRCRRHHWLQLTIQKFFYYSFHPLCSEHRIENFSLSQWIKSDLIHKCSTGLPFRSIGQVNDNSLWCPWVYLAIVQLPAVPFPGSYLLACVCACVCGPPKNVVTF